LRIADLVHFPSSKDNLKYLALTEHTETTELCEGLFLICRGGTGKLKVILIGIPVSGIPIKQSQRLSVLCDLCVR
jgi:hypothetical protein